MKNSGLDRSDIRILSLLQVEGRLSNLDLAQKVNLSPTATSERVKRLTRDGYILGYTAILNPEKVGRAMVAFIEVKLDRTSADVFDTFAKAIKKSDDVMECHMVAGGFDYLVKVRVGDMEAYRRFLADVILPLPGVRETHTYTVMEEVKTGGYLAVE